MLEPIEFIELYLNASEEVQAFVEAVLEQSQPLPDDQE